MYFAIMRDFMQNRKKSHQTAHCIRKYTLRVSVKSQQKSKTFTLISQGLKFGEEIKCLDAAHYVISRSLHTCFNFSLQVPTLIACQILSKSLFISLNSDSFIRRICSTYSFES